ncbi:type II secretion system F family protein [Caldanaerobacter subterraneus]|uniref:type II secretion system F family protein n=1 Tax=Caldanaerobacter subterraneus TaxID=911092 RepID=UPI001F0D4171|nr:type II secretion system F domain-containing protein [Caldanaerobacter subterraneus]
MEDILLKMYRLKRKQLNKIKRKRKSIDIKQYIEDYPDLLKLYNKTKKDLDFAGYSIKVDDFIAYVFASFIFEVIVFGLLIHSFLLSFVFSIFVTLMVFFTLSSFANSRKQKMMKVFPNFIKAFMNEFSINQNLKHVFNAVYPKVPEPLNRKILNLTMQINNSTDITEPIMKFKNEMDNVYVTVFCELILIYNEKGGPLLEHLDTLLNLIEDEERMATQKASEMTAVVLYLPLLSFSAIAALILNLIYLPMTRQLFFHTTQGQFYFGIGVILTVVSLLLSAVIYHQNKL